MKIDVTKLPLGEALIGFVLVAVVLTFLLAFASTSGGGIESEEAVAELPPAPGAASSGGEIADGEPAGEGTVVEVAMIPIIQFDVTEISVPAGQPVTLTADNQEPGIPHNWAFYTSEEAANSGEAALAATAICTDCLETITFDPPDPGVYFFRCDVHPIQMVGTITVE